jgi:hypothetical protein
VPHSNPRDAFNLRLIHVTRSFAEIYRRHLGFQPGGDSLDFVAGPGGKEIV